MAFNDCPMVDKNAELSEISVLNTRKFLSKKNGFISRESTDDVGVDLDVELIVDNSSATNSIFAVQIKSQEESSIVTVRGEKYLSHQFKTSRLGHLCRSGGNQMCN